MKSAWILALVLCLSACAPAATATPTLPPPPVVIVTRPPATNTALRPTPLPRTTAAPPSKITLSAADGVLLAATLYPALLGPEAAPGTAGGVVLVHMLGRTRADWDGFARELQLYGLTVIALDLRGHGETGGAADWGKAPGDVRTAWEALVARPEVARRATAIVGASLGGNLALIAGANNPEVATVIALSPGLDYQGVQPAAVLGNFGDRPVFFVASQADAPAYDGVKQMAPQTPKGETHYFVNAGHGTEMFADPALMPLLIDWLTQKLGVLKG